MGTYSYITRSLTVNPPVLSGAADGMPKACKSWRAGDVSACETKGGEADGDGVYVGEAAGGVAKAIEAYRERALAAVQAAAAYVGQEMQDAARQGAPWQDRTGNARGGLFFAVDGFGLSPIMGRVTTKAGESSDKAVISGGRIGWC